VAVLVNGLGATPLEELYLLFRKVSQLLDESGVTVARTYIGEFATSLEMAGASVSLCRLDDDRLALPKGAGTLTVLPGGPTPMNTSELKKLIVDTMTGMQQHAEELRGLDAALGDGDLGITVASGAKSVIAALDDVPDEAPPSDVATSCARAFASANPSTMAALVAGALLAGSKVWDRADVSYQDALVFADAAATSISTRGKSEVGDKTILDAMAPAIEALKRSAGPRYGLAAAIEAAREGVESSKALQSRRGRAAWLQERSVGLVDPGATAFLRFLEELQSAYA
jgi:phosphoenolpyruvate---glycerone phosphotransferase subunit DhaL